MNTERRLLEGRRQEPPSGKRRGQMYSIIALLIIIPIVIFIAFYLTASQDMKFGTTERVISDQEHQIAQGIENDFSRAMKITGRRALLAAVNNVIASGQYLDNSTKRLEELMINSSIYGNASVLMANNTLTEWRSRILAQDFSFDVDANFSSLRIENYDGMNLKISMMLTVNVSDDLNISRIDRMEWKNVLVSVEGLEDPLYPISSTGYVKKVVTEYPYPYYTKQYKGTLNSRNCSGNSTNSPADPSHLVKILIIQNTTGILDSTLQGFAGVVTEALENLNIKGVSCFVSGAAEASEIANNQTVFIDNITKSAWLLPINTGAQKTYYFRGIGPNFLQRMEGNISASPDGKGMESFVLEEIGIPDKGNQTKLDYLFFSNQSYPGCQKARWTESWLNLQPSEIARYNLTNLSYAVC